MATSSHFDGRLTYDDLVRLPDDGMRHEIIDGIHYVTPSPVWRHQRLVRRLLVALAGFLEAHSEPTPLLPGFSLSTEKLFQN